MDVAPVVEQQAVVDSDYHSVLRIDFGPILEEVVEADSNSVTNPSSGESNSTMSLPMVRDCPGGLKRFITFVLLK